MDAVLAQTRRFVLLEDGDVVVLDGTRWAAYDGDGRMAGREEITVVRATTRADHDGHGSFLAKEIGEQPGAVSDTLLGRIAGTQVHLGELDDRPGETPGRSFTDRVAAFDHLVVVGCGTALHAGEVARPMFERWSALRTEVAVASEWRYAAPIVDETTLVVAVSQSGETADTLAAVRLARSLGAATIGITNMPDSQLTREVDRVLLTRAGLEMSVAASKTFTTQVALLSLLAFELGSLRDTLGGAEAEQALVELELIPEKMAELLRRPSRVEAIAESIARRALRRVPRAPVRRAGGPGRGTQVPRDRLPARRGPRRRRAQTRLDRPDGGGYAGGRRHHRRHGARTDHLQPPRGAGPGRPGDRHRHRGQHDGSKRPPTK